MWIRQRSAYFKFIPSTHTDTHTYTNTHTHTHTHTHTVARRSCYAMARGHCLNTSIVLAAVHSLLGLLGQCMWLSLRSFAPFLPNTSNSNTVTCNTISITNTSNKPPHLCGREAKCLKLKTGIFTVRCWLRLRMDAGTYTLLKGS